VTVSGFIFIYFSLAIRESLKQICGLKVLTLLFSNSLYNSSSLDKGSHDRDGVWISDLN